MRKLIGAVVVAGAFAAAGMAGCSSDSSGGPATPAGFSCDSISTAKACPNDTALTADQVTAAKKACNDELAGSCKTEYKALGDCGAANPSTCGADGKSVATTKCDTQAAAYLKCKLPPTDGGTDTGTDTGGGTDSGSDATAD